MPNKRQSTEDIAEKAIAKAKALTELNEQKVRKQLMESFAPQLKKMISQSLLELEDEDLEMEEGEDEEMYEEEDGVDPEDLEDLENALEEGEDEDEFEDEPVEMVDDPEEDFDDAEEMEEASDDYEELEEESEEDFLAELQSLLEEEDEDEEPEEEVIQEMEGKQHGDSYKSDAPSTDVKKFESNDGGSHTQKDGGTTHHTKKYEAVVAENKKLKDALKEITSSLNESVLDDYKTTKFKSIVEGRKLTETAKLKVMRAIDEGKSEKEVDRITSVFETTLPKSSKKSHRISESSVKGGRNSSIKKPRSKRKAVNESTNNNSGFEWANRLAQLADVK